MQKLAYVYFCLLLATLAVASKTCSKSCQNGRDGKDGINGKNGANGADGKDGKNEKTGIDGINGKNGHNGIQGCNGEDGKDGKNGVDGKDGIAGTNGMNGKNGVNGVNGKDGQSSVRIGNNVHGKGETAETTGSSSCCKRWFITINGKECQNPVPIDAVVYLRKGKGTHYLHRPRVVIGVCKISTTGVLNIAFNVRNCSGYGNADAHTGWNSSSHMYIEELDPPQA